jgi:wobble nucleotide-excising tRNase
MGKAADCPEKFSKYNLIYGYNGSGKSTISRVFRFLEYAGQVRNTQEQDTEQKKIQQKIADILSDLKPTHDENVADFSVHVNDQEITQNNYESSSIPAVRVFNDDFIRDAIDIQNSKTKAIVFLGKEQQVLKERRDRLTNVEKSLNTSIKRKKHKEETETNKRDKWGTDRAQEIAKEVGVQGRSFERPKFFNQIPNSTPLSDEDKERRLAELKQQPISNLPLKKQHLSLELAQEISDFNTLLAQTPQSVTIEKLKNNSHMEAWVREGFTGGFHEKGDTCAFCNNTIDDARWDELGRHFSDAYEKLRKNIEDRKKAFEELKGSINNTITHYPDSTQFYPAFRTLFDEAKKRLDPAEKALQPLVLDLIDQCDQKLKALNQGMQGSPSGRDLQDAFNEAIQAYNDLVTDNEAYGSSIQKTAEEARKALISHYCSEHKKSFEEKNTEIERWKEITKQRQDILNRVQTELGKVRAQINKTGEAAKKISEGVAHFLGHASFSLEPAPAGEGGYVINRHGRLAKRLSEGERTALAIVHFTHTLQEEGFDLSTAIVMMDDPISSLDAQALHMAYAYINEHIGKKAGQFFLLTHNDRFMYEWKRAFNIPPYKKENKLFMTSAYRKQNNQRHTTLREMPELLKNHESEYHYIFKTLHEFKDCGGDLSSEKDIYHYPNMARKMWEIVCKWKYPNMAGKDKISIIESLEERYGVEQHVQQLRLCRLFNSESHKDIKALDTPDWSAYYEFKETCRALFALIEIIDNHHYDGMVKTLELKKPIQSEPAAQERQELEFA